MKLIQGKKNNLHLILILVGFILSVILSTYYVTKYDKYIWDNNSHQLIKDETYYHWVEGAKIAKEVREGKNFFLSGDTTVTKPLHQRIIGIYSLLTGYNLVDSWEPAAKVSLEGKLPFLIIQSFFYFFAVYFFSKKVVNILPDKAFLFVILFLSFEFTIFQYHSSFWTESIYFSLQLLVFGMLLERRINFSHNLFIGILIGLAFLQRSGGVFYIFPVLLCYIFLFRKKISNPFLGIVSGFILICILIGMFNYHKTKVFYVFPPGGKWSLHSYFSVQVLAEKLNISHDEARKFEVKKVLEWADKNNIKFKDELDLTKVNSPLNFRSYFLTEKDKIKFFDYINYRQYEILLENPLITIKKTIYNTAHIIILNPTFNHYYNTYRGVEKHSPEFVYTETHKNWIPFRITYTLIIYIFCLMGLIALFNKKKFYEVSLILFSVLYYVILFGWYGKTRLYVPSLIYLAVFFGVGVDIFLNSFKEYKKTKI